MMREILFRGKRLDNGKWVDGNLFVSDTDGRTYILIGSRIVTIEWEVDPSTIGQYTGLTDKNGKQIFEGDIVEAILTRADGCSELTLTRIEKGIIGYDLTGMLGLQVDRIGSCEPVWSDFFYELDLSGLILDNSFEVLGNIYDNPEIFGGESDA